MKIYKIANNPNQIKVIDTIVRDSNEEIVPLSKRFNSSLPDIRSSDNHKKIMAGKHIYWKHHVSSDFLEHPHLISNNGVGKGGTLFSDFKDMVNRIGYKKYWVVPIVLDDTEIINNNDGTVDSKVRRVSKHDFAPVQEWEKRLGLQPKASNTLNNNYVFVGTCVDAFGGDANEIQQIVQQDDLAYSGETYFHNPELQISKEEFIKLTGVNPKTVNMFFGHNKQFDVVFSYAPYNDIHSFYCRLHHANADKNIITSEIKNTLDKNLNDIEKEHREKGVEADTYESENVVKLDHLRVEREYRNQGLGSSYMQDLCDYADRTGKDIELSLGDKEKGETTSKNRLIRFYQRFGFVRNFGRTVDYRRSCQMYRRPRKNALYCERKTPTKLALDNFA